MGIEIKPIQSSDIPSVVECIQIAFEDDPYNNWVFDKQPGKFNKVRNYASLKARCEWGMRNALFYVAKDNTDPSGKVIGVSMWLKPRNINEPQTWNEWFDEYLLWVKQGVNLIWYGGRGGLRTDRYWIWKQEQTKIQSKIWTDPNGYYFCNNITVHPDAQGKGIGRKLCKIVTDMADQEGRRSYLESSKDIPNVAIYEKMGFKLVEKLVCGDAEGSCDLYCMIREPQPVS